MKTCEATKMDYDHRAAREKMTQQDVHKLLMTAQKQYQKAYDGENITCAGTLVNSKTNESVPCNRNLPLLNMYRCFFCGAYFCPRCARAHFGSRSEMTDAEEINHDW